MPKGIYERKKKPVEVTEEVKPWTPEPQIVVDGDVIPPTEFPVETETETDTCKNKHCKHPKSTHYGPYTAWCNLHGCKCERFWTEA